MLPHILAVPVAGPSLELHRLVVESYLEFGDSGGVTVWWRPCSSPTLADPIYKRLRTPKMVQEDRKSAADYRRRCKEAGGEENYQRDFYHSLASQQHVARADRPAVLLVPAPDNGARAVLKITPAAFESATRRRALAIFLQQELGEDRIREATFDGTFNEASMATLQEHADRVAEAISKYIANDREIPARTWRSAIAQSGLIDYVDPEKHTVGIARRERGSLFLQTITYGNDDGEVEFKLEYGEVTKQMALMWMLLLEWRGGLHFRKIVESLYGQEYREAYYSESRALMTLVTKRVRTLVHDIREKKLRPLGINPEILPKISRPKSTRSALRLQLLNLDRDQLGHLKRLPNW